MQTQGQTQKFDLGNTQKLEANEGHWSKAEYTPEPLRGKNSNLYTASRPIFEYVEGIWHDKGLLYELLLMS